MRRLVAAEEAERHRVANELHDDAVQALAASVMHLGVLAEAGPAAALREELERSGEAAGVAGEVGWRLPERLDPLLDVVVFRVARRPARPGRRPWCACATTAAASIPAR